jgi:hypothetical protein
MFDKRTGPIGIVFVGPYVNGQPLKSTICDGDTVELHIGSHYIKVIGIVSTSPGGYKGNISNFGPPPCIELPGLKRGQEVEFAHDHIFACR